MSLSSSPWDFGLIATHNDGVGGAGIGARTGMPLGASVSPVALSASLATATRSPAGTSVTGSCSLPRSVNRPCSRSSARVRVLVSTASAFSVPLHTLSNDTRPTNGSAIVLPITASGSPLGSQAISASLSPAIDVQRRTSKWRRRDLGEELRQAVDADASRRRTAHHREHRRVGDAVGEGLFEFVEGRDVALEVALHQVVVGDDDAFDQRVVHHVFGVGEFVRHVLLDADAVVAVDVRLVAAAGR